MMQLLVWAALLAALLLPGEQHALSREFVGQAQRGPEGTLCAQREVVGTPPLWPYGYRYA
jgi:hypothetical protein